MAAPTLITSLILSLLFLISTQNSTAPQILCRWKYFKLQVPQTDSSKKTQEKAVWWTCRSKFFHLETSGVLPPSFTVPKTNTRRYKHIKTQLHLRQCQNSYGWKADPQTACFYGTCYTFGVVHALGCTLVSLYSDAWSYPPWGGQHPFGHYTYTIGRGTAWVLRRYILVVKLSLC